MRVVCLITLLGFLFAVSGCQKRSSDVSTTNNATSRFLVTSEPPGAIPAGTARELSGDGDDVVVSGLIGGSARPFVEGLAAFTIVDPKVPFCQDEEGCPTPWDYCCQTDAVKRNIATVKLVDETGKLVAMGARDLLPVRELSSVVVKGVAKRDEQGNLTIAASQVFVKPDR